MIFANYWCLTNVSQPVHRLQEILVLNIFSPTKPVYMIHNDICKIWD